MAIDRLSIIWKSDHQSDKIKQNFFQVVAVSVLLYGCTSWALMKKKLERNTQECYVLNKSWKHHLTKQ